MIRTVLILLTFLVASCYSEVYVRDGVTDGNRFNVSISSVLDDDPVRQSWLAYSLAKSVCQLEIGGDNPARANSFGCEFSSRGILLDTWEQLHTEHPQPKDDYLTTLAMVREAAYLDEYVVHYFEEHDWFVPAEVDMKSFNKWRRKHLRGHQPYTQIIGSWTYSDSQED